MRWTILSAAPLFLFACAPPPAPAGSQAEAKPEPVQEGAIPWAPGEAPTDPKSSAREVTPLSEPAKPTEDRLKEDGVKQTGGSPVCTGKAPPSLRAAVQVRSTDTRACHASLPADQAGTKGELKFSLRIGASGEVEHIELLSDTLGIAQVTQCAENTLKESFSETPPRGGCTTFVIPIHIDSEVVPAENVEAKDAPSDGASPAP